jgi:hypothetical protein
LSPFAPTYLPGDIAAQNHLNNFKLKRAQKLAQQEKNKTTNQELINNINADLTEIGLKLEVMAGIWNCVSIVVSFFCLLSTGWQVEIYLNTGYCYAHILS